MKGQDDLALGKTADAFDLSHSDVTEALFGSECLGRWKGVPVNRPVERLDSLKDLAKYEDQVLDAIGVTPHGALLFLSDPLRFLEEVGFVVGEGLQAELDGLPGLKQNSPGRYEDIRAGKGRAATWRVQIRSLGLRSGELDMLDRGLPR